MQSTLLSRTSTAHPLASVAADVAADPVGERALVERLRAGDPSALKEMLDRYWASIHSYARRLLADADAGTDVAQETFVRLWANRATLRPDTLRTYVYRVAHNLAVDELRKSQTRTRWFVVNSGSRSTPATPAEQVESDEVSQAVVRAIDALPPRRREAFTLAYVHQMSYEHIAEVMQVSPATVKNQMAAALADLRKRLRPFI